MKDMSKMEGTTNIFRGARPPLILRQIYATEYNGGKFLSKISFERNFSACTRTPEKCTSIIHYSLSLRLNDCKRAFPGYSLFLGFNGHFSR